MTFLNPTLLWGMLAVAVPIALHFWHQQRAKPMPWAMLRWLETPNQPPKRGFRFDNLWLLLLRCALLVALALLLARPTLPPATNVPTGATHLIEPDKSLVEAYRFELEQARQRGDRLFWATDPASAGQAVPVEELGTFPANAPALNPLTTQAAIEQLQTPQTRLHLYVRNTPAWTEAPTLSVPTGFVLHALPETARPTLPNTSIRLANDRFLTLGSDSRLTVSATAKAGQRSVATAPLRVLVQFRNPTERQTVGAALGALSSVYGLTYLIDEQAVTTKIYDWIITDQPVETPAPGTLYMTTAPPTRSDWPNITYLTGPLTPANEAVANGLLPEQLGQALVSWLDLTPPTLPLSATAFAHLFVPTNAQADDKVATATLATHPRNSLQMGLLVLFLSLLLLERWLAIRRGV